MSDVIGDRSNSGVYDLLDQVAEEFAERLRRGERPGLNEYTARYPELADQILAIFPAMVNLEQAEVIRQKEEGDRGELEPPMSPPALVQVGDYLILREIGHGGMGVVYEAEQVSLGRRVALKILPQQVARDSRMLERFRREARAVARLHHTNIVPVFEVGRDRDICYYAMQFIQGHGLNLVYDEIRRLRSRSSGQGKNPPGAADIPLAETRSGAAAPSGTLAEGARISQVVELLLTGKLEADTKVDELASTLPSSHEQAANMEPLHRAKTEMGFPDLDLGMNRTQAGLESMTFVLSSPTPLATSVGTASQITGLVSSTVLPGGTQLSTIESHRSAYSRSVVRIGLQAAEGLAYAHSRGVIHRDIKPSNLLLDTNGVVWITDFGLAKADDAALTQTGDIIGTISYMAPRAVSGRRGRAGRHLRPGTDPL